MTDVTNEQTSESGRDPKTGQFVLGHIGAAGAGRPRGSRNKLGEQFIQDLYSEWQESGLSALKRVAADDPTAFVRLVAGVLPRELDASLSLTVEHIDLMREARTFAEAFRLSQRLIGGELSFDDSPEAIELEPDAS